MRFAITSKKSALLISILILFSLLEFMLLLRHKDPFTSDSRFYEHMLRVNAGASFNEARAAVLSQIDRSRLTPVEVNFYYEKAIYTDVLRFFTKRPLYPLLASGIFRISGNVYLSLLLPAFIGYALLLVEVALLLRSVLTDMYALLGFVGLITFYPLLDWASYFMTDIIAAALWIWALILLYRYIIQGRRIELFNYSIVLIFGLLCREQALFLIVVATAVYGSSFFTSFKKFHKQAQRIVLLTGFIVCIYLSISYLTHQKTIVDTLIYTAQGYGLATVQIPKSELVQYYYQHVIDSHRAFAKDLSQHHWWFLILLLSVCEIVILVWKKNMQLFDVVILASGGASYASIFIYPVLSYRYFIPVVVMVSYFAARALQDIFQNQNIHG